MEAESFLLSGYGLRTALEARTNWKPLGRYARVWQPSRLKGILVSPEFGMPFLAATQVFDLRPVPRKWLALDRTPDNTNRLVKSGDILVTCSGSVGRATMAYSAHLNTLISHDLLRVEATDQKHWGWVYAYLRAPTTRAMMTSAQYGHVIKHLEVGHLNALPVPELRDPVLDYFTERVRTILDLREQAHTATLEAEQRFANCFGPMSSYDTGEAGFTVRAEESFFGRYRRIDGWPHSPRVQAIRNHLSSNGHRMQSVTACGYRVWVPGRYKRIQAEDGVVFIDSSDLFEINPDCTKRFADCRFGDEYSGRVEKDWLLMASSGQTYGIMGGAVLANDFYEDKVVANHVIRLAPGKDPKIRAGYLLTALSHPAFGRPIVKSYAFGSSVPEISPEDITRFSVVRVAPEDEDFIAEQAELSAELRGRADILETAIADEADGILSRFVAGDV